MSSTDVRRLILAVDLVTVATLMVWVGSMPASGTGREILLFGALLPLAAAV